MGAFGVERLANTRKVATFTQNQAPVMARPGLGVRSPLVLQGKGGLDWPVRPRRGLSDDGIWGCGSELSCIATHHWRLRCTGRTDCPGRGESPDTRRIRAGYAPWITFRLPGAPPASAGSRYTSQACSRREGNGGCVKITRILGVPDTGGPNTHIDWRRSQPSHPKRPQGHFKANC